MLYLFFNYFLISCICLWAGILIYSFISSTEAGQKSFIQFLVTGLVALTAVGQWIVLFLPINLITLLALLALLGIVSRCRKKRVTELFQNCLILIRSKSRLFYICLFCFLFMVLILNAGPYMMDDTDSYHIQMVKWIQEYGSVPGVANLHLRFGFNSSWFVSIALFTYPFQGLNGYGCLNGLLSVWLCFYLLEITFNSFTVNPVKSNGFTAACLVLFVLCLLNWPMIRGSATSANYDFIGTCCIIMLFIDLFTVQNEYPVEWLIWPVYLFTVRIMNFPLLILSLVHIFRFVKPLATKKFLLTILTVGFVITPFLIRNSILSGYPFFPVYQLDFFSFDWKADKTKLIEISRYIKLFNRVNPMFQPLSVTETLDFPKWVASWYSHLFRYDRLIVTISFFGYLVLLIRTKRISGRPFMIFLAVMVCQLISWFFAAPDPRFVYGSLLFGIFAAICGLPFPSRSLSGVMKYSLILGSTFILLYAILKVNRENEYRNFLIPSPIPVPAVQTIVVDHIQMRIPERILNNWNPRCYDIELPCLYKPDPRLQARGQKIADGFRLKNTDMIINGEYKITE